MENLSLSDYEFYASIIKLLKKKAVFSLFLRFKTFYVIWEFCSLMFEGIAY